MSFLFFFLFRLSWRSFVRSKSCADDQTFQPRVDFRVHSLHTHDQSHIGLDATAENQTVIHFSLIGAQRDRRHGQQFATSVWVRGRYRYLLLLIMEVTALQQ